jgi:nicotinamidase-related amidase
MVTIDGKEVFTTMGELVDPKHTALVLIDMQNDFLSPGGVWDKRGRTALIRHFVPRVKQVLDAARRNNVLVVHVQMTRLPGRHELSPSYWRQWVLREGHKIGGPVDVERCTPFCVDGTWGWRVIDEMAPLPGELTIRKHHSSAFIGTPLDMLLDSNGIKSLVFAGLVTHGCVIATVIDAGAFNYYTAVLGDCVVNYDPELHKASMLVMGHSRDIVDSKRVLEVWNR